MAAAWYYTCQVSGAQGLFTSHAANVLSKEPSQVVAADLLLMKLTVQPNDHIVRNIKRTWNHVGEDAKAFSRLVGEAHLLQAVVQM